jgi:hypothetical protein
MMSSPMARTAADFWLAQLRRARINSRRHLFSRSHPSASSRMSGPGAPLGTGYAAVHVIAVAGPVVGVTFMWSKNSHRGHCALDRGYPRHWLRPCLRSMYPAIIHVDAQGVRAPPSRPPSAWRCVIGRLHLLHVALWAREAQNSCDSRPSQSGATDPRSDWYLARRPELRPASKYSAGPAPALKWAAISSTCFRENMVWW